MYGLDFRRHVLKVTKKEGLSIRDAANRFSIASRTLVNGKKRLEPIVKRNKKPTKLDPAALIRDVEDYPDAYQYERAARLGVSKTGLWHALKRFKISYKKKPATSQSGSRKAVYVLPKT